MCNFSFTSFRSRADHTATECKVSDYPAVENLNFQAVSVTLSHGSKPEKLACNFTNIVLVRIRNPTKSLSSSTHVLVCMTLSFCSSCSSRVCGTRWSARSTTTRRPTGRARRGTAASCGRRPSCTTTLCAWTSSTTRTPDTRPGTDAERPPPRTQQYRNQQIKFKMFGLAL